MSQQKTQQKKKPRGKAFPPGESPNPGGVPKVVEPLEGLDESVDTAADMLYVYGNQKGADRTPGHRVMRAWLERDPRGFAMALRASRESGGELVPPEEGVVERKEPVFADLGSDKCVELVEELLDRYGG